MNLDWHLVIDVISLLSTGVGGWLAARRTIHASIKELERQTAEHRGIFIAQGYTF